MCVCVCVCVCEWRVGRGGFCQGLYTAESLDVGDPVSATSPNNPEPPLLIACPSGSCGPLS